MCIINLYRAVIKRTRQSGRMYASRGRLLPCNFIRFGGIVYGRNQHCKQCRISDIHLYRTGMVYINKQAEMHAEEVNKLQQAFMENSQILAALKEVIESWKN